MKKVKLLVFGLAVVLALALVLPACAPEAAPPPPPPAEEEEEEEVPIGPELNFKVSHQWAEGDVRDRMARDFGEMVTEQTNGTITFTYYPAKALFKPVEQWDAMILGALDMSVYPLSYASGKVPELDIALMPCVIPNFKVGCEWYKLPIGKKIDEILAEEGVIDLVWANMEGTFGAKPHQIKVPEDVKGLKMRAAGKMFEYMLKDAGAAITSMPSSEAYHALATGVIDAMNTSSASFVTYHLYEQLDYINVPENYATWYMSENLCIGKASWEKLSEKQREIFLEAAKEMHETWVPREFGADTKDLIEAYEKAGVDMYWMTKDDWEAWRAFAEGSSWKAFVETAPRGEELLELAMAAAE